MFRQGMGAAAPVITTIVEESRRIEGIILEIKHPSGLIYNNNKSRRANFQSLDSILSTPHLSNYSIWKPKSLVTNPSNSIFALREH